MSFLSINLIKTIKNQSIYLRPYCVVQSSSKFCSKLSNTYLQYDKDPGPQFRNDETQSLLKSITRLDINKIYRKRSVPNRTDYKFLTTEEVEEEVKQSGIRALSYLQMPPVVKILQDEEKVISNDPALKDFSDSTYVFTDITFGLKNTQRKVIMRQIDGSLVTAPNSIRKRMNQIYFPLNGRKIRLPRMFEEEHLQKCLTDGKYDFILDRLCVQFEPFESDFHEISSKVYLHINENKKFDELRSTRHFGPMAFFFAWHKIIDDLIFDMIKRDYLRNCVELIVLMYKLNNIEENSGVLEKLKDLPEINEFEKYKPFSSSMIENEIETSVGKSENDFKSDDICLEFIDNFVKENSIKKTQLELALQTYRETNEQKRQLFEGLNKAHGIN